MKPYGTFRNSSGLRIRLSPVLKPSCGLGKLYNLIPLKNKFLIGNLNFPFSTQFGTFTYPRNWWDIYVHFFKTLPRLRWCLMITTQFHTNFWAILNIITIFNIHVFHFSVSISPFSDIWGRCFFRKIQYRGTLITPPKYGVRKPYSHWPKEIVLNISKNF